MDGAICIDVARETRYKGAYRTAAGSLHTIVRIPTPASAGRRLPETRDWLAPGSHCCRIPHPQVGGKGMPTQWCMQKMCRVRFFVLILLWGLAAVGGTPQQTMAQSGNALIGQLEGPEVITDPAQYPRQFNEAPQLAELVKAGKLPPVAERIGQDPLVIKPVQTIGKYG